LNHHGTRRDKKNDGQGTDAGLLCHLCRATSARIERGVKAVPVQLFAELLISVNDAHLSSHLRCRREAFASLARDFKVVTFPGTWGYSRRRSHFSPGRRLVLRRDDSLPSRSLPTGVSQRTSARFQHLPNQLAAYPNSGIINTRRSIAN
jgi:hypothetical protein